MKNAHIKLFAKSKKLKLELSSLTKAKKNAYQTFCTAKDTLTTLDQKRRE